MDDSTEKQVRDALVAFYLDWVNNYLTVRKMAANYMLSVDIVSDMIDAGRDIYEERLIDAG